MRRIIIIFLLLCSVALAQNPYRVLNSFNAGEISPLLNAREDLAKYQSGCSLMENLIPLPQGGAQKRPGTKYIAEVKNSSLATRIIEFEFSTTQSYIIEIGNQYARFFTDNSQIQTGVGTEDLSALSVNLVAHWKLNDDANTTAVDDDVSSIPHDGTASSNTEDLHQPGKIGSGCFDFAGTDYVTIGDHAELSFGDGGSDNPFSIAAWIYVKRSGEFQFILSKYDTTAGKEWDFGLDIDRKPVMACRDNSAAAAIIATGDTVLIVETWYFLVTTYSGGGSNTDIKIYVNGTLQTLAYSSIGSYTAMENLTADVLIGARMTGSIEHIYANKIDNVALFDKELSSNEVSSLYSTGIYEISTPYLTADLFKLKYEQSADVLYITHPDYETRKLSRLNDDVWLLDTIAIKNGPFRTQNTKVTRTISASATTGSITLTAAGHAPFISGTTAGHLPGGSVATSKSQIGALFKLVHPLGQPDYTDTFTTVNDFVDCNTMFLNGGWTLTTSNIWRGTVKVQRNYTIGAAWNASGWETIATFLSGTGDGVGTQKNFTTSGTEDYADADYQVIYTTDWGGTVEVLFDTDQTDQIGIVVITAVASVTSATATVLTTLASTDATHKWSEGSWSNYRGWPATVAFFEDRLMFGGNTDQPDTIWGSATGDYENMTAGVDDADALSFTLTSRQVNVIEWLIGKDKILIGTSGAEWTLEGSADEPLTPTNMIVKQHSTYGSANLQAVLANESVLFFQRGKEKMRELAYNWELDSYVAPDMTILANLVTDGGIDDTAFQKIPDSILWCVRNDGEMPVFSYERAENITAWSRLITTDSTSDSDFESVARIHGSPEDEIWVVVKRTINDSTVRYIEQFQPRDFGSDPNNAFYVDCGATYTTDVNVISDLTWLEGESVVALADGDIVTSLTVAANSITLGAVYQNVQIGLPYTVKMRTMPLSWLGQGVTIHGRIKRISEVVADWYKSGDFSIGKDIDNLEVYSISGQTTSSDRKSFPPGYDRNGYVYIWQKSPEPLTVLAIAIEFNVR